jgi:hypothetical protein
MPNKWMQTGYGKPLRAFLLQNHIQSIIDFGDLQVFDEATTYPCILNASKRKPGTTFKSLTVKTFQFENGLDSYNEAFASEIPISELSSDTWIIKDNYDQKLITKLKIKCISLSKFIEGKSYRGILTGLTEAFLINNETKNKLINEDERSGELIKPFLLGRNIKPYLPTDIKNWLILIPKGFTIKKNLPESNPFHNTEPPPSYGNMSYFEAWDWFRCSYSAISNHLLQFKNNAEARGDKGDITKIVEKIILAKKSNPSADTSALEAEIDRLVYELYGLTEEEIRIVEGVKA